MKKDAMAVLGLALILGAALPVQAATTNTVAVVMSGQTEVNRETYKFLQRNLAQQGISTNLTAVLDTKTVKAGTYKAVVVLSTGVTTGLDPALKSFVDSYSAKNELFVVSLLKNNASMTVQAGKVAAAGTDVDVVTAASAWSEGSQKMTYVQLHAEWVKDLAAFLKAQ